MGFNILCDLFLLREVSDPIKVSCCKDEIKYVNNRTRDCPLFCRGSPFSKDVNHLNKDNIDSTGIDIEDVVGEDLILEDKYCAMFHVGFVLNP